MEEGDPDDGLYRRNSTLQRYVLSLPLTPFPPLIMPPRSQNSRVIVCGAYSASHAHTLLLLESPLDLRVQPRDLSFVPLCAPRLLMTRCRFRVPDTTLRETSTLPPPARWASLDHTQQAFAG